MFKETLQSPIPKTALSKNRDFDELGLGFPVTHFKRGNDEPQKPHQPEVFAVTNLANELRHHDIMRFHDIWISTECTYHHH